MAQPTMTKKTLTIYDPKTKKTLTVEYYWRDDRSDDTGNENA